MNKLFEGQRNSSTKTTSAAEGKESSNQTRQAEKILITVSMFYVITSIPNVSYLALTHTLKE